MADDSQPGTPQVASQKTPSPTGSTSRRHRGASRHSTTPPTASDATAAPGSEPPHNSSPSAGTSPAHDIPVDEDYDLDDSDSAVDAGSTFSDTTSLYSDIMKYRFENGRRYHSYKDGEYWGPNDEEQNNQLDIAHNLYLLTLDGKLFLAPIGDSPQQVLDVGTGTGIWKMDFADQYPSAQVIGFDLSPIQPAWAASNVRFEVNDASEADWGYMKNSFDFIHTRAMYGSIADWPAFYQQVLA
jgi:hypothetical protein